MEGKKQKGHGNRMESEAAPFAFAVRLGVAHCGALATSRYDALAVRRRAQRAV